MESFLESQKVAYPDLQDSYETFLQLYERKLWHELSMALFDFLSKKSNHRGENIFELYAHFISKIEPRLSQVRLAQLVSIIGHSLPDPQRALDFFKTVLVNKARLGDEATFCLEMDIVQIHLKLGAMEDAASLLEEAKGRMSSINSTETIIFSKFYRSTTEYRKLVGPPQEFYKAALMYLAYTSVDDLPEDEKFVLATDMALASITGDDIFNFGEVIATPILAALKGTPNEWLCDLVMVMNKGDIDSFNSIVDANREAYFAQPALSARHEDVKKKIVLLCLMNVVFELPSHERTIPFSVIASRTRIPIDQTEWVLMRAMSLKLIKGTIDEVEQTVNVTWVQPRVLGKEQLSLLVTQLDNWTERVKGALVTMEDQTAELFA